MADFGLGGIIASVLAGAAGGQAAEKQPKTPSPGGLGSLLGGGAGGVLGGLLTSVLGGGGLAGTNVEAVAGQAVGGGVLGTVVTIVLGLLLKKKA